MVWEVWWYHTMYGHSQEINTWRAKQISCSVLLWPPLEGTLQIQTINSCFLGNFRTRFPSSLKILKDNTHTKSDVLIFHSKTYMFVREALSVQALCIEYRITIRYCWMVGYVRYDLVDICSIWCCWHMFDMILLTYARYDVLDICSIWCSWHMYSTISKETPRHLKIVDWGSKCFSFHASGAEVPSVETSNIVSVIGPWQNRELKSTSTSIAFFFVFKNFLRFQSISQYIYI